MPTFLLPFCLSHISHTSRRKETAAAVAASTVALSKAEAATALMTREAALADQQRQRNLAIVERQQEAERALAGINGEVLMARVWIDTYGFGRFTYNCKHIFCFLEGRLN